MEQTINTQPTPAQTGKSRDPFKMWTIIFALLFVAAGGFGAWAVWQLNSQNGQLSSAQKAKTDAESNSASLQSQLNALKGNSATGGTGATDADSTKILAAVDAHVRADVNAKGDFKYTITKNTGKFATVSVGVPEGGGYELWVKKVGDNWTVLFGGQDSPTQALIDQYGIPTDL